MQLRAFAFKNSFCQNTQIFQKKKRKKKRLALWNISQAGIMTISQCTINWIPSIPLSPYYALPWFYINQHHYKQPDNVSGIICSCVQSMWPCYGFCHCFQGIHGQYEAQYINKGKILLFGISLQIRFLMWRSLNADKNIKIACESF